MPKLILALLIVFLSGCAPNILLVHPTSGKLMKCGPSGSYALSLAGQIVKNMETERCAEQYEALGYVRADKLTPEQRAMITPRKPAQQRGAKLFPVKGPFANYGITLNADYVDTGTGHGTARILYPNNLILNGEYSTLDEGQTIKLMLISPESIAAYQATSDTSRGLAVFSGTDGTVLECVYALSKTTGSGAGICQDNRGNHYRLVF